MHMKAVDPPPPEKSNFIYSSRMPFAIRDLNQLEIDHSGDSEILAMMRKMYPALGDQQLIEAKENLERYLKLAWRIADRIVKDSENRPLTTPVIIPTIPAQRSKNTHLYH